MECGGGVGAYRSTKKRGKIGETLTRAREEDGRRR
jgi:hypothetical protein